MIMISTGALDAAERYLDEVRDTRGNKTHITRRRWFWEMIDAAVGIDDMAAVLEFLCQRAAEQEAAHVER